MDRVATEELPRRYTALNFLFPHALDPQFGIDREAITREAATHVGELFRRLVKRGEDRERAQRFVLQMVVAMFAEDTEMMPRGIVSQVVQDCLGAGASSYDLFGALFRQMDDQTPARAGRFKGVPWFNGGLFSKVDPIELNVGELSSVKQAAEQDWSRVNPAIFGALFQASMDENERHRRGAHFTSEADIMKIVAPTIGRPWEARIDEAKDAAVLLALRDELLAFRVLDPACGSGNFLYVAYRELVRLEILLLARLHTLMKPAAFTQAVKSLSLVKTSQFYGLDTDSFAIELAKVTLTFAKKFALDEALAALESEKLDLSIDEAHALPLDNLDANIMCADALFTTWPRVDAIVGNPPFQSKNKIQKEFGRAYVNRVREAYPDVPGLADFCVYWVRKAHDHLLQGQRAGLVGTNTIRQNQSRVGGLDYVVSHGGTITDAVSTQAWSGDAPVHVSIVNWVKGAASGPKRLSRQVGDGSRAEWEAVDVDVIDSALSFGADVTAALTLRSSADAPVCHQGQTHGHTGFLIPREEAEQMIAKDQRLGEVLFPFLTADELLGERDGLPTRYVVDFGERDRLEAQSYRAAFERVRKAVLPDREKAAAEEKARNKLALQSDAHAKVNHHHERFLAKWWQLSYGRGELMAILAGRARYVACGRVTKRPIFEFVSTSIHPNDALAVFTFDDDYSFGILQSNAHWTWFTARCSTLEERFRYTSNSVFDSFPWPQSPSKGAALGVAKASRALRTLRDRLRTRHRLSLRDLYRSLDGPGDHPLKDAHAALDAAVGAAYGFAEGGDVLTALAALNLDVSDREARGEPVTGPGLPIEYAGSKGFVSGDCTAMPDKPDSTP